MKNEQLDHILTYNEYCKASKLSRLNEDQTDLPPIILPECLRSLDLNIRQYRNMYGAIIREWDKPESVTEEQGFALLSIMFGHG